MKYFIYNLIFYNIFFICPGYTRNVRCGIEYESKKNFYSIKENNYNNELLNIIIESLLILVSIYLFLVGLYGKDPYKKKLSIIFRLNCFIFSGVVILCVVYADYNGDLKILEERMKEYVRVQG